MVLKLKLLSQTESGLESPGRTTKESVYIRIVLKNQHGRSSIVLGHQYGHREDAQLHSDS